VEVLRHARVGEFWDPPRSGVRTISPAATLSEIMRVAVECGQSLFPVVGDGGLAGEVSIDDVRRALLARAPDQMVVAQDLMHPIVGPLVPEDDLERAAQLLAGRTTDAVLIVPAVGSREVIGIFSRRDLVIAYARRSGSET